MKLARVIVLPSSLLVSLFAACSDPPSPPAQGAVAMVFSSTIGQCLVPGNPMSIPPDPAGTPGVVTGALHCDLTVAGCKPDQYVAAAGDPDTSVECTISPTADSFNIDVKIKNSRISFQAAGTVTATGGTVTGYVFEQSSGQAVQDSGCKITFPDNKSNIKKGAIWAQYECDAFKNKNDPSATTCTASGAFIFENCGS